MRTANGPREASMASEAEAKEKARGGEDFGAGTEKRGQRQERIGRPDESHPATRSGTNQAPGPGSGPSSKSAATASPESSETGSEQVAMSSRHVGSAKTATSSARSSPRFSSFQCRAVAPGSGLS